MNHNQKRLIRIAAGLVLLIAGALLKENASLSLAFYLIGYVTAGWDVILAAVSNIARGQVFDENFLMTVATVGAFFVGEYPEGIAVMLFYQVGEYFQGVAVNRSRRSISSLLELRPDSATVLRGGERVVMDPDEVQVGELIVVRPGERIPLDGKVTEGVSSLDASALTGESVPRDVAAGDEALSGCINLSAAIIICVTRPFGESAVSRILDLVENAAEKKSRSEAFITKFARYYTPAVVGAAALLAVVPPLVLEGASFRVWIYRALTFLVVSCPCALVVSIPLTFFGGIGGASRLGILVKGGGYLEALSRTETVVFDKTGTLTKGRFEVRGAFPQEGVSGEALTELAAYAQSDSTHPIALSLRRAYGREPQRERLGEIRELAGRGISARVDGSGVLAGNEALMKEFAVEVPPVSRDGTLVHVARDGVYLGYLVIEDLLKDDAAHAVEGLRRQGVGRVWMLTGDRAPAAARVAEALGLDGFDAQLLPGDKVERLEAILEKKTKGKTVVYAGDGINDAPVLARADVGIAMGGLGSDAAIEAADVVIMPDEPGKISEAIRVSRRTVAIAGQNIVFALGVKLLVLILGALGITGMWWAVFADAGVAMLAVFNALRVLKVPRS